MKPEEQQIVLAAAGYYSGGIDGQLGPKSKAAFDAVHRDHEAAYTFRVGVWREHVAHHLNKRKRVAAIQACLNHLGFEAGVVDGREGHNTREALNALLYKLATGKREVVDRIVRLDRPTASGIPHQREVKSFYGDPGRGEAYMRSLMTRVELPFRLRIDYNLRQSTNKMTVHNKVASSLEAAMIAVHANYGIDEMKRLGIDRYAGGFNYRKMRGGSKWSMHAYGCAVDFYAAPNGLRMRCPQALFCGPEYKPFLDIMQGHGWLPAIRLWGADAMHFQAATI